MELGAEIVAGEGPVQIDGEMQMGVAVAAVRIGGQRAHEPAFLLGHQPADLGLGTDARTVILLPAGMEEESRGQDERRRHKHRDSGQCPPGKDPRPACVARLQPRTQHEPSRIPKDGILEGQTKVPPVSR
ncbi:hypothetical protein GCM10007301_44490 [Azorhizobium oxalatiphilum]|uniref:Uncharacterized protein n=1 Tax=Azorhizobium oxalatiphilum TaxID=980631 RepID=A0A917FFH3_9HYPH|nr:hypothetical protein GCM10007301_44490 [Azorhizobium oxalatiphilum]